MKCKARLYLKDSENVIKCDLKKGHGGDHRRQIDKSKNAVVSWENLEDNWDDHLCR